MPTLQRKRNKLVAKPEPQRKDQGKREKQPAPEGAGDRRGVRRPAPPGVPAAPVPHAHDAAGEGSGRARPLRAGSAPATGGGSERKPGASRSGGQCWGNCWCHQLCIPGTDYRETTVYALQSLGIRFCPSCGCALEPEPSGQAGPEGETQRAPDAVGPRSVRTTVVTKPLGRRHARPCDTFEVPPDGWNKDRCYQCGGLRGGHLR